MSALIMHITELCVEDILINIGKVLEIEEKPECFSLIIERMDQKQIWTFSKDESLIIFRRPI